MPEMKMWRGGPPAVAFLIVFCLGVIPADAQVSDGITGTELSLPDGSSTEPRASRSRARRSISCS